MNDSLTVQELGQCPEITITDIGAMSVVFLIKTQFQDGGPCTIHVSCETTKDCLLVSKAFMVVQEDNSRRIPPQWDIPLITRTIKGKLKARKNIVRKKEAVEKENKFNSTPDFGPLQEILREGAQLWIKDVKGTHLEGNFGNFIGMCTNAIMREKEKELCQNQKK